MTLRNILVIGMALALFSCSKDKSAEKPDNSPNDSAHYQPSTAGSSWHYKDAVDANGGFTLTAANRDTMIGNIRFNIFNRKPDTSDQIAESYFAQDGHNYYAIGLIQTLGDNPILYLKDTTVNSTWTQDISINYSGITIQLELDFTLAQANISKEINSRTYQHVAQVSFIAKALIPGAGAQPMGSGYFYAARGVGLLALKFTQGSSTVSDISLDSYTIK